MQFIVEFSDDAGWAVVVAKIRKHFEALILIADHLDGVVLAPCSQCAAQDAPDCGLLWRRVFAPKLARGLVLKNTRQVVSDA